MLSFINDPFHNLLNQIQKGPTHRSVCTYMWYMAAWVTFVENIGIKAQIAQINRTIRKGEIWAFQGAFIEDSSLVRSRDMTILVWKSLFWTFHQIDNKSWFLAPKPSYLGSRQGQKLQWKLPEKLRFHSFRWFYSFWLFDPKNLFFLRRSLMPPFHHIYVQTDQSTPLCWFSYNI